jgi:hypothetical protein
MSKRTSKPTTGPVEFIDRLIRLNEKGEPFRLAAYQRRTLEMALRRDPSGELISASWGYPNPRNQGRRSWRRAWLSGGLSNPHTEIIFVANDEEQATGRVFKTAVDLIEHNHALKGECEVSHEV